MIENYKNPKIRKEIKRRILVELEDQNLPRHRRWECQAILSDIKAYEKGLLSDEEFRRETKKSLRKLAELHGYSEEYPLGGMIEPYDIDREFKMMHGCSYY